ncbi:MAG TPA: hypothetical protein VF807_04140 [Ktedonobacterales bacterium]
MEQTSPASRGSFLVGLLRGLIPLIVAVVLLAITTAGATWIRSATNTEGFFAQQAADVFVVALGLLITALVFGVLAFRAFRVVRDWQAKGLTASATGALWALAITAGLLLVPVVLAFTLPQYPAAAR